MKKKEEVKEVLEQASEQASEEEKSILKEIQGRTFTASLKPAWSDEKISKFIEGLTGHAIVWAINHTNDEDDEGNIKETHTHIVIDYKTPRKITTVAKRLEVDNNFVEVVRNKRGIIRYLVHTDDKDKYQYDCEQVKTNSLIPYKDYVMRGTLSDKDIVAFIERGEGLELIGIVEPNRLNSIQRFLHYNNSQNIYEEIKALRRDFLGFLNDIDNMVGKLLSFSSEMSQGVKVGLETIAREINQATAKIAYFKQKK